MHTVAPHKNMNLLQQMHVDHNELIFKTCSRTQIYYQRYCFCLNYFVDVYAVLAQSGAFWGSL